MAGPTTAALDDDIKELKTSIQRIIDAIHVLEVTTERGLGEVRGDIKSLNRVTNGILAVALLVLGSLGGAIWYFAKLDSRVGQLEQQIKVEAPKR